MWIVKSVDSGLTPTDYCAPLKPVLASLCFESVDVRAVVASSVVPVDEVVNNDEEEGPLKLLPLSLCSLPERVTLCESSVARPLLL